MKGPAPDIFTVTMQLTWAGIEIHERREIVAAAICHDGVANEKPDHNQEWKDFTERQRTIIFLTLTRWHFFIPHFFEEWPLIKEGHCGPDIVAIKFAEAREFLKSKGAR